MTNIELERRALLDNRQRDNMLKFMNSIGEIKQVKRIMIDFSGENRSRTVMIRVNNDKIEIVAKSGALADTVRVEANLQLRTETTLEEALNYMAVMGYEQADVFIRHMHIVNDGELEFSVRDVFDPRTGNHTSTLFDLEAIQIQSEEQIDEMGKKLMETFRKHNLEVLSPEKWTKWANENHQKYSLHFQYSEQNIEKLIEIISSINYLN
jgi:hypothetical protein